MLETITEMLQSATSSATLFLGWAAFALAILIGLLLDLLGLFGNWIILAAIGVLWGVGGWEHFGIWPMLAMLALALLGEGLEFILAAYGAKKFGGSKGGMIAALVGTLVGAILGTPVFPLVGTLIGACLGAFAFAAGYEHLKHEKDAREAMWTGTGAALGKVGGLLAKLFCGLAMLTVAAFTY